jgi:hypothetical protein
VVDMGVRNDDLLELKFFLAQYLQNALDLAAGIDDHGLVRLLIANNGAITLQPSDRKDLVDHKKKPITDGTG